MGITIIINPKKVSKFCMLVVLVVFFIALQNFVLAGGGDSCFLPGTLITLENGSQIPIENVKVGEKIIS